MKQVLSAAALGLVCFGGAVRGEDPAAEAPRVYKVECRLLEYDAEGKKSAVSSPTLVVREGSAGRVFVGQQMAAPGAGNTIDFLEVGASMRVLVRGLTGGKVCLEASAEYSWLEPDSKSRLQVRSIEGRAVESIRLGEVHRVELGAGSEDGDAAHRQVFEVTVQEADRDMK